MRAAGLGLALALLLAVPRAQEPVPPAQEGDPAPAEGPSGDPAADPTSGTETPPAGTGEPRIGEPRTGGNGTAAPDPVVIELLAPEAGTHPDAPRLALGKARAPVEIEQALATLAERYPGQLRIASLGRSEAGRPLPLAILGAEEGAPAIFFGDHDEGSGGPRRRDLGLGLVDALLSRAQTDAELRGLLARTTVYVAPVLAADARALSLGASTAPSATRFDQNFPAGWQPDGIRPGSGPYPLSLAEARALHGFLREHTSVAVAVGFAAVPAAVSRPAESASPGTTGTTGTTGVPGAGSPSPVPAGPAEGARPLVERVFTRGAPAVPAAAADGPARGGWLDTCRDELGIETLRIAPSGSDADALVPGVAALLACLPALEFGEPAIAPLSAGMWQVDVTLSNPGRLPTRSALARERFVGGDVGVDLRGGQVVAAAYRAPEDPGFRVLDPTRGGRIGVGELRGGEAGVLRLVLEAPAGAELTLAGRASRAGGATLPIRLP